LEDIINSLYRLFAEYPAENSIDIFTKCCILIEHEALLAITAFRNIFKDLLQEYNDATSIGNKPIYEIKHFLPRYLDLINQFQFPSHSREISLKRLSHNTIDWKPEVLSLLQHFAIEYFNKCLHTYPLPDFEQIDRILIMLWHPQFQPKSLLIG
jgi:hypothetical protein